MGEGHPAPIPKAMISEKEEMYQIRKLQCSKCRKVASYISRQGLASWVGPAVLPWTSSLTALGCLLPVLQVTVGTKAGDVLQV